MKIEAILALEKAISEGGSLPPQEHQLSHPLLWHFLIEVIVGIVLFPE